MIYHPIFHRFVAISIGFTTIVSKRFPISFQDGDYFLPIKPYNVKPLFATDVPKKNLLWMWFPYLFAESAHLRLHQGDLLNLAWVAAGISGDISSFSGMNMDEPTNECEMRDGAGLLIHHWCWGCGWDSGDRINHFSDKKGDLMGCNKQELGISWDLNTFNKSAMWFNWSFDNQNRNLISSKVHILGI